MAHPTVVTFPGDVRILDPGPKDDKGRPPRITARKLTDEHGDPKGTAVTVPPGYELQYELVHASRGRASPGALVKVVAAKPAEVLHAELEHEHELTTSEATIGTKVDDDGVTRVPNVLTLEQRKLVSVTAKSTAHEGLEGKGADAAEAAADLRKKIAAKLAAPKPSLEERVTASEELPVAAPTEATPAPEPDDAAAPPLAERRG